MVAKANPSVMRPQRYGRAVRFDHARGGARWRWRVGLTRRGFLGTTAAAGLVAACTPAAAPSSGPAAVTPVKGGNLIIASAADIISLDPTNAGDGPSGVACDYLYECLTQVDVDGVKILPSLATSWEVNSDKVYTFKLRQGVKFHDGTDFNAAAVKAHFDRLLGPEKPLASRSYLPWLDKTEAVDNFTVRFTTKVPYAFFVRLLSGSSSQINSPTAVAKFGKDYAKNPVGTGPYKFGEWLKDERFVAVRNDDYWGPKAYLDKVTIKPYPDAQARVVALQAGDIHYTADITPEQTEILRRDGKVNVISKMGGSNTWLGMNVLKKPYDDVRVRQAMNYAIDKASIVKNIYNGDAVALNGMSDPHQIGFFDTTGFPYNPAKAKELLAAAGLSGGFTTDLLSSNRYPKDLELMQFVQQQLKDVGVTAKINQKEFAAFLEDLRKDPRNSPVQMWRDGRGGSNVADYWLSTYGCNFFRPNGGNTNGSCDPEIDKLANEAVGIVDETKYNAISKTIQEKATPTAYSVWLFLANTIIATSKKVRDPRITVTGGFRAHAATWLEP